MLPSAGQKREKVRMAKKGRESLLMAHYEKMNQRFIGMAPLNFNHSFTVCKFKQAV
jgi:hypothetical protein